MNQTGQIRRRHMLSNPRVQLRIILLFIVLAGLFAAVNVYVAKRSLSAFSGDVLQLSLSETDRRDVQTLLAQQRAVLDTQLMILTFLSFVILGLSGVVLSHRIGGPIYQLTRYLEGMTAGTVQPRMIRFRKGDFFDELAARFNDFQRSRGIEAGAPPAPRPEGRPLPPAKG